MNTTQKYLFLDRSIVDGHYCENTALHLCKARKDERAGIMLKEEYFSDPPKRWEVRYDNGYPQVIRDQENGTLRLYYTTFIKDDDSALTPLFERPRRHYQPSSERITATCFAISNDGIEWEKPELGIAEFEGCYSNNILLKNAHGTSVLFDPDDPNPTRRYKLITKIEYSRENTSMGVAFSQNGINFSPPQTWPKYNPRADTHNFVFKDPRTGHYVLITRIWKDGLRIVAKSESNDFLNWSEPVEIARGAGFEQQIYSMPVFYYAGLYFGLASIFHDGDCLAPDFDTVDVTMLYSSNLEHFDWIEPGAKLIERGLGTYPDGDWDCGCIYASPPIEIDNTLCIYYMGGNGRHTDFRETGLGRAWIEKDKFAYYSPKDGTRDAVITLRKASFYGDRLRILADIEDCGWIKCELLREVDDAYVSKYIAAGTQSNPVPSAFVHASGWSDIRFGNFAISSLGNASYALRFTFRNARMYALDGDLSIIRRN